MRNLGIHHMNAFVSQFLSIFKSNLSANNIELFSREEMYFVDSDWYLETYADVRKRGVDAYKHFVTYGIKEGRNPNAYFDAQWYLAEYADVAHSGQDAVRHYLRYGAREGRDPSDRFSTNAYLTTYQDVARTGMNPLLHYLKHGRYEGRLAVSKFGEAAYQRWIDANDTLSYDDIGLIKKHIAGFDRKPLISVVVPVYNTYETYLRELVAALQNQFYENWELCIADDASPALYIKPLLQEFCEQDARIKYVVRPSNGHISAATNSALTLATGDFIALVDHDDLLPPHALYEIAAEVNAHPDVDVIYSDSDRINSSKKRFTPHFKNDWNLDLLLGQNMVNHLGVYRRSLVEQIGGLREGFEGSQDYDLILRAADATAPENIRHIPTVLYHWRMDAEPVNFSSTHHEQCVRSAKKAIEEHLERRGQSGKVVPASGNPGYTRVIRDVPAEIPLVSIIIPTRDRTDLLKQCISGLLDRTDYARMEVIIVDNESSKSETRAYFKEITQDKRIRVLPYPGPFNYSAMNNAAVSDAKGDIIVLLNNDTEVIHPEWLTEMVSHAVRPEVGAVGAKLYYSNGRLQHGGVILGYGGSAGHYFLSAPRRDGGYYSDLFLTRRVSAVTAACIAFRREVFMEVGGLDAENLKIAYNDVDFCIRLGEAGYHVIWTPYAELYHHESASRGSDQTKDKIERFKREQRYLQTRWPEKLNADPFYNPNLDLNFGKADLADVSRRKKPWLEFASRTA